MKQITHSSINGLYDPLYERDACGVGLVCNLKGEKSHKIISDGLAILENLAHRGATGADAKTGDGAGILMQMPDLFLRKHCSALGIKLPAEREYGAGLVFFPPQEAELKQCQQWCEEIVKAEGQTFLGWRDVPVQDRFLGDIAKMAEPQIKQIFIGRGPGLSDDAAFERKLYVIRRLIENAVRQSLLPHKQFFHIVSLSYKTLNYKGLFLADQIKPYYPDLSDQSMVSGLALVHQRYSTNTFPTWELAQPFRFLCHNGEINTLRGNINWMNARQGLFKSDLFGADMAKIFPVLTEGASDSAILDNALELLYHTGRSLPHAVSMLIPEAWENNELMDQNRRAFYEYHSCLMEPWDGPASIPFTDGICIGAVLDRNGLRPSRYTVTKDGFVFMSSETGVVNIDPSNVLYKGRLQPGRMFLVDTQKGRIIEDEEIKAELAARKPYWQWLQQNAVDLEKLPPPPLVPQIAPETLNTRQRLFGYSLEDLKIILAPMAIEGGEPTGSMGTDVPLAVLSEQPQLLYNYFKQLFAQVTNPPLDSIREEIVTSLFSNLGAEGDLFAETPEHCRMLFVDHPILADADLERIKRINRPGLRAETLPIHYKVGDDGAGLEVAIKELCDRATAAIEQGFTLLVLSDRGAGAHQAPIPALLAVSALHHHLVDNRLRMRCSIVVESAEPREVHHFCLLFGYGANAVNPYLALATVEDLVTKMAVMIDRSAAVNNYLKAAHKGVLKTMAKMGISTLQSYRGAQIFEAVGISRSVIDKYFAGTASRLSGIGIAEIAREVAMRYAQAYPEHKIPAALDLEVGGLYKWRRNGEAHLLNPAAIAKLQHAVRAGEQKLFREFSELVNNDPSQPYTLRSLMSFKKTRQPIPLEEVESWTEIAKRFKTGAMSFGSISREAHETLAIAMNRIGGRSNSGEGGEEEERFRPGAGGEWKRSAIKQVASGRFGVTSNYLCNAKELQIKMAQGAKPGEGGQLPGLKVYPWIAKTRHSTPYVTLISPPPHHDIYSIEDLAQLIHDLKNSNREARISVKLVSEVGVGTIAAGVAKGKAELVLISGYDGGTGASPQSSIRHAGLPWELGLAETHQTLVRNGLRSRIAVECDGKLLTGRDVAIACLLGAEEFGFATGPLISLGCVMMRVCHLNTCPVGIATQDPELRRKFAGRPEHVINFFRFVAEELRELMASLGFRSVAEMVGHADCLEMKKDIQHWKAKKLDFEALLAVARAPASGLSGCTEGQDHGLDKALDHKIIEQAQPALLHGRAMEISLEISNTNRTVGTMLSYEISRLYGEEGLPDDTLRIHCRGSAGQSFCAFGANGLTVDIEGDANDYFGKGLSGAKLVIRPPRSATFKAEENIIVGNVAFYGATSGYAYIRGLAGERFCVRNSGVETVVEGVGDHGCEYMTGGRAIILGRTGRNFAAGMSGGIAFVLDVDGEFVKHYCNTELVYLEKLSLPQDVEYVQTMIKNHYAYTDSQLAQKILADWNNMVEKFVKVMPIDYKNALERLAHERSEESNNG